MPWLAVGLGAALWFLMFAPFTELTQTIHSQHFWPAMTASTLILSALAIRAQRDHLRQMVSWTPRLIGVGILHSIFLYGLSRLGVFLMLQIFGEGVSKYLNQIYSTRDQLPTPVIAALLFLVIAPAEELVWRGWVQDSLARSLNQNRTPASAGKIAWLVTSLIYCGIHAPALNPPLLLAALVLGIHWGYLYFRFGSLIPGLVSHALWDVAIFAIFPVKL